MITTITIKNKISADFIVKGLVFEVGEEVTHNDDNPNCLVINRKDGNGRTYSSPIVFGYNNEEAKIAFEELVTKNK